MKPRSKLLLTLCAMFLVQWSASNLYAQTIINPSFETPNVGPTNVYTSYIVDPTNATWVFTGVSGNAGIAANGSGPNYYHRTVPDGSQFAFLQGISNVGSSMAQTITNIPVGNYTFSFYASQRDIVGRDNSQNQTVTVLIDGTSLGSFTPASTNWILYNASVAVVTPGNHTLSFTNLPASGDATILIDDVTVQSLTAGAIASNSLIVDGILDVSGNISYGTTATNDDAVLLDYTDVNPSVSFIETQPGAFLLQDAAITNSRNKLFLDISNNVSLYGTNGTGVSFINPNTSGGITFPANYGDRIIFADGSSISSGTSLTAAAIKVWNQITNGTVPSTLSSVGSIALGSGMALGTNSMAIGSGTATGTSSTAFGTGDSASGGSASAAGYHANASAFASVAFGEYNLGIAAGTNTWITNDPVIEIGNGSSSVSSNALTVFKTGELRNAGLVQSECGLLTPPTGNLMMGSFTNGSNPATLIPTNGLRYPNGQ